MINKNNTTIAGDRQPFFKRLSRGAVWSFIMVVLARILEIIQLIVAAHFLLPADLGTWGTALLLVFFSEMIFQPGFYTALVQKAGDIVKYLDTAWTIQVIRGGVIFIFLYGTAPLFAGFFGKSYLVEVIRIIAFARFISGFCNIGVLYFNREIEIKRYFIFSFIPQFIGAAVSIAFLFLFHTIWALVFGALVASLSSFFLSFSMHPYRPRWDFNVQHIRELAKYGKWIMGSGLLGILLTKGIEFFIAKLLGMVQLGFYQMSFRIANTFAQDMYHVVSHVAFPAYARSAGDQATQRSIYFRFVRVMAVICIPMSMFVLVFAPAITILFLGREWLGVVMILRIMSVQVFFKSIGDMSGAFFKGIGRPDIETKLQTMRLTIIAVIFYPLIRRYGIEGAVWAILVSVLIEHPVAWAIIMQKIKGSLAEFLWAIGTPFFIALAVCLPFHFFMFARPDNNVFIFCMLAFTMAVLYACFIFLAWKFFGYDMPVHELFVYLKDVFRYSPKQITEDSSEQE